MNSSKYRTFATLILAISAYPLVAAETVGTPITKAPGSAAQQQALERAADEKINQFSSALKTALMSAVKQGGFSAAVEVCNNQAPDIAAELSADGWNLRRTSLKTRNADNQPDDWEAAGLALFAQQMQNGVAFTQLQRSELTPDGFRFMRAIPTTQLCLACHGSNIEPNLAAQIKTLYPNDQATGFSMGDIRGAFSLTKTPPAKED